MSPHLRAVTAGLVCAVSVGATVAQAADSPACAAARQRVAYDENEIAKVNNQLKFKSIGNSSQDTRNKQLQTRAERLRADLGKEQAQVKKLCGISLSTYDGTYSGHFGNTAITVTFTVKNGVFTGGLTNDPRVAPLSAKTGIAYAQATFADCGTFAIHFDPTAGTATAKDLTCTLAGIKQTADVVAQRG